MWENPRRSLTWGRASGAVAALLAMMPLLVLAAFSHPSTDDFCYANATRELGFWRAQESWWVNWSGRIVGTASMSLAPLSFPALTGYKIFPAVALLALFLSLFWLTYEVLRAQLATLTILAVAFAIYVVFVSVMPSPAEGIYWYTGTVVYTCAAAAALASAAAAVRAQITRSGSAASLWASASALFAFLAAGSNEVVLILHGLSMSAIALLAYLRKAQRWRLWLVPLIVIAITAAINLSAPGNARRGEATHGFGNPFPAALGAAALSAAYVIEWLGSAPILIGMVAAMLAGVSASVRIEADSAWRRTPLLTPVVLAAIGVWATFFLTAWASGFVFRPGPPLRVANVVCLFFLLATACAAFMFGLQRLSQYAEQTSVMVAARRWLPLAMLFALLGHGNIRHAYEDLMTGRAAAYDAQLNARYARLAMARQRQNDEIVQPLDRLPVTIHFRDIAADSSDWRNRCLARFWDIPSVRLSPSQRE